EGLSSLDGVSVFGPQDIVHRSGVVSFSVKNVHPHDVAALLNEQGIAVRAGHHCAMPLTQLLGVPSTSRASVGIYTTSAEIDSLLVSVKRAHSIFSRKA
ncbi:MAG: aminotransferase class V-fold PLP-dependent enzyme, partial [archaeon]